MSYRLEVELVRRAHEEDLLTTPYVFSAEDAVAMTEVGADIVVCHMGLTSGGSIGAGTAKTLDDCVTLATEWAEAARSVRSDVIVLVHGDLSRSRRTCGTSSTTPPACTASTVRRPWNAFPPNVRRRGRARVRRPDVGVAIGSALVTIARDPGDGRRHHRQRSSAS
jgi:hypothetical protein